MKQLSRAQLFEHVLVQLDSACGEAAEQGAGELANFIADVLIPFIQDEMITAGLAEMEE